MKDWLKIALCRLHLPGSRREMARCRETVRVLQAYVDGELDEAAAAAASRHLELCRRCCWDAELYLQIKQALARRRCEPDETAVARLQDFAARLSDETMPRR